VLDSDNASLEAANVINEEHRTPSLSYEITLDHTHTGKENASCIGFRNRISLKFRSDERYDGIGRNQDNFNPLQVSSLIAL